MSTFTFHPDLATLVDIPEDGTISRTVYQDPGLKAVLFGFAPGQELSEHTAAVPAVLQFVRGRAQVTVAGETQTAESGAWVHMEARVPHAIRAETPTVMLLLLLRGNASADPEK